MTKSPSVLTREAGTSTPPARRSVRRPSTSHVLIAIAALLAFGLNYLALENRDSTVPVAVATRPIAAGTPFSIYLVRFADLPTGFEGLPHLIAERDVDGLEGWIVGRPVAAGELVDRAIIVRPGAGDGLRTMSIPVAVEHAVGATVVPGDRVDVISLVDDVPAFIASNLEVVSTGETGQAGLSGAGPYHIVVGVTADEALALAGAIAQGSIEVVRSTGSIAVR